MDYAQSSIEAAKSQRAGSSQLKTKPEGKRDIDAATAPVRKLKFTYREQAEFDAIEDTIADLERNLSAVESSIQTLASDYVRLGELMADKVLLEKALATQMDRWVYLNDLAERIESESRKAGS